MISVLIQQLAIMEVGMDSIKDEEYCTGFDYFTL